MTRGPQRAAERVGHRWGAILTAVLLAAGCGGSAYKGITRTYYIAADEVLWDYAPSGRNMISGLPIGDPNDPYGDAPAVYLTNSTTTIGPKNWKAIYREYTDATFTTLKPVDPKWAHLGMLGPVIRGIVGDTIVVVFKNNTTHLPATANGLSMHPHGVLYTKESEGTPYLDYQPPNVANPNQDTIAVPPGATHTYTWKVVDRSGPGPADGSSVLWMYHSHIHEVDDTYSGLIGALIVTGAQYARHNAVDDPSPVDVDREFVTMYEVSDENQSSYLSYNETYYNLPSTPADPDAFTESNKKHSINGYVFGNQPLNSMTMYLKERVRWYVFGMGTENDLHTPHFHGNTVTVQGMRTDVMTLLPGTMAIADMKVDDPGVWLYHCHVGDHIRAGMISRYQVCTAPGDPACKTDPYPLK